MYIIERQLNSHPIGFREGNLTLAIKAHSVCKIKTSPLSGSSAAAYSIHDQDRNHPLNRNRSSSTAKLCVSTFLGHAWTFLLLLVFLGA